CLQRSDWLTF
nr:immunoglobulin light chain junction region [Macaca mulatta]MOW11634.1 immunoglobulin light chain junction region [Macaca mulatta]MOW13103.1 immunoglobulin light chain junction region [Macaca mulatta]MOW14504.1 immunoglobulin light chain junction region [Macaca mulatta]